MKFDVTAVTINMSDYVKTIIANMLEEMVGKAPIPAANHLFKIRERNYFLCGTSLLSVVVDSM